MTSEIEAAGRLRKVLSGNHPECAYEGSAAEQIGGINRDRSLLADAYLRETDPTPLDIEMVRSLAVDEPAVNVFSMHDFGSSLYYFHILFADDGGVYLAMCCPRGHASIDNPTIGDYHKACALFGITLTQTGAGT